MEIGNCGWSNQDKQAAAKILASELSDGNPISYGSSRNIAKLNSQSLTCVPVPEVD
jgi:hypothetical protein